MDPQLSQDLREELRSSVEELQTLRDRMRVKMHLAGMEAKDTWAKLEPRVTDFEAKLGRAAGKASVELKQLAHELTEKLKELNDKVP